MGLLQTKYLQINAQGSQPSNHHYHYHYLLQNISSAEVTGLKSVLTIPSHGRTAICKLSALLPDGSHSSSHTVDSPPFLFMLPLRNTYSANFLLLLLADVTFISLPTFLFLFSYTPALLILSISCLLHFRIQDCHHKGALDMSRNLSAPFPCGHYRASAVPFFLTHQVLMCVSNKASRRRQCCYQRLHPFPASRKPRAMAHTPRHQVSLKFMLNFKAKQRTPLFLPIWFLEALPSKTQNEASVNR